MEKAYFHMLYGEVQRAKDCLEKARETVDFNVDWHGNVTTWPILYPFNDLSMSFVRCFGEEDSFPAESCRSAYTSGSQFSDGTDRAGKT